MKKAEGITWDLSVLYQSLEDERIESDFREAHEMTQQFVTEYKGKLEKEVKTSAKLLGVIMEYENILAKVLKPFLYATLLNHAHAADSKAKDLFFRANKEIATIENELFFFDQEYLLNITEEEFNRFIQDDQLSHYQYWLINARRWMPYTLSEETERIINLKNVTGRDALVGLYSHIIAHTKCYMKLAEGEKEVTLNGMHPYIESNDRTIREEATRSITQALEKDAFTYGHILHSIVNDHCLEYQTRNIKDPMMGAYIRDQVSAEMVSSMLRVVRKNFHLANRFYNVKAKMLGLKNLEYYDVSAEIRAAVTIPFEQAQDKILSVLADFDHEFYDHAQFLFTHNRIDAEVRPNKGPGGYCLRLSPELKPMIFLNYHDTFDDLMTLAHEMGHGIHYLLSGQNQTCLTYSASRVIAESASNFCTNLVMENLIAECTNQETKCRMLAEYVNSTLVSICTQVTFALFEIDMYKHAAKTKMAATDIDAIWRLHLQELYGKIVNIPDEPMYRWARMVYYYTTPFVCYTYAFADLFVLALFDYYKRDKEEFLLKFKKILKSGGKYPPDILADMVGINFCSDTFWQQGITYLQSRLEELENLVECLARISP